MTELEKMEQICNNPEALKMADRLMGNGSLDVSEVTELVWDKFFG